jgi:1,4-dihydroxy-2-naphthoyl-CoA hydrolase
VSAPADPKPLWWPGVTLEAMNARSEGTLVSHLGIRLTELGPDFLRGTMSVDERTVQPMRILHGGASMVLAETLASVAANCSVDPVRFTVVGQEINANHVRAAREGSRVEGTSRPLHLGARSQVWSIEIVNAARQLVCVSRITLAVIDRPARERISP